MLLGRWIANIEIKVCLFVPFGVLLPPQHRQKRRKLRSQGLRHPRAVFPEGEELYPEAGFLKKAHVQIVVRNIDNMRGIFRVPAHELKAYGIPERV
jgi:hypothetical protein